jgi:hypothetical protein
MLTAARAFDGETVTDVLSAVVSTEPDWSKLPPTTPTAVQRLLRRCLRKDVRSRLQSAGDARVELDEAVSDSMLEGAPAPPVPIRTVRWLPALAFTAAGAAIAVAVLSLVRPRTAVTADPPVMRYTIALPQTMSAIGAPTISPDGRWIAISALGPLGAARDGVNHSYAIWLRPMDGDAFQPIAGTEQGTNPAWSPDSRELAFVTRGVLYRIPIAGGTATRVAGPSTRAAEVQLTAPAGSQAAWGSDGTILLSSAE